MKKQKVVNISNKQIETPKNLRKPAAKGPKKPKKQIGEKTSIDGVYK